MLRAIWDEGMQRSQLEPLAQALTDSLGPRLTGAPEQQAAHAWAAAQLAGWGAEARVEPYGTWIGWRRGTAHVDLVQPRTRTLEARLLAYSRGTDGAVTGEVVALPEVADSAAFAAWLGTVRGRFVLLDAAPVTCRPTRTGSSGRSRPRCSGWRARWRRRTARGRGAWRAAGWSRGS